MLSRRLLRIKVAQAVYSHLQSGETNIARTQKELIHSANKCYELFLLMLLIPEQIKNIALEKIEIGRSKLRPTPEELNPNMRFVENPVIEILSTSESLQQSIKKLSWGDSTQMMRAIYNDLIDSDSYKTYMAQESVTFNDHKKIVKEILRQHIEDNQLVEAQLEDLCIFWLDDIGYALSVALQTISTINEGDQDIAVPEPYKNDDYEFAVDLLQKTLLQYNDNISVIDSLTDNWEVERIAIMDKILMATAITEMTNFTTIPIKATLDEFIEISKYYSTPQSSTFINGILDKASNTLSEQGKIKKSGRGLL